MKSLSQLTTRGQTRDAHCENHGPYLSVQLCGRVFSKCPACSAEIQNKRAAAELARNAQQRHAQYLRRLGDAAIPPRFQNRTLDNFNTDCPGKQHALDFAQAYVQNYADVYRKSGKCAVFVGPPGTGKTHLACAIAHGIIEQGFCAVYSTVSDMLRRLRSTYNYKNPETENDVLHIFTEPDLLILDEIGVQFGTEYEKHMLFDVIDHRYRKIKNTIILSNMPFKTKIINGHEILGLVDFLGDQLMQRLHENAGEIIPFVWDSERPKIAATQPL